MSLSMLNSPFFVQMKEGAQAEAKAAEVAAEGTGQDRRAESGAGRKGKKVDSMMKVPVQGSHREECRRLLPNSA
ncbi:hypothetical protein [Streptomyces sp. NPDC088246]|uniref:hypothetical protein n=1 Tax=Streptomyces sp. NPDC088246 TaxID=3365842 RepID=UPI00382C349E